MRFEHGTDLEQWLTKTRDRGRKLLVPYVTGGLDDWIETIHAVIDAGADAVEVGIPFSDPIMDGPVIQEASQKAIESGATPMSILSSIKKSNFGVPVAIMTYYNIVYHAGHERFAKTLADCGISGSIIPDLQLDEATEWIDICDSNDIDNVLLAAPSSSEARLKMLVDSTRGFIYGVGLMGVTGERDSLASSAREIARKLKSYTAKPVLVGVGVSNASQAIDIATVADGVIVGSALVRRLLEGQGPEGAFEFIRGLRVGLDTLKTTIA